MLNNIYKGLDDEKFLVELDRENKSIVVIKLEIKTLGTNQKPHVTITADEIAPIERTYAEERAREYFEETFDDLTGAETYGMSRDDWVDQVIYTDGLEGAIENGGYYQEPEIDGKDYLFEFISGWSIHDHILKLRPDLQYWVDMHDLTVANWDSKQPELMDFIKAKFKLNAIVKDDVDEKLQEYAEILVREND